MSSTESTFQTLPLADVPASLLEDEDLDSLNLYYLELSNAKLFRDKHQEWERGSDAATGDLTARNELITRNLKFAASIARRYSSRTHSVKDLHSKANIGLIIASKEFNPKKNVKFISYAVHWIKQQIYSELAYQELPVVLPLNVFNSVYNKRRERYLLLPSLPESLKSREAESLDEVEDVSPERARAVRRAGTPPRDIYGLSHQVDDPSLISPSHGNTVLQAISDKHLDLLMRAVLTDRERTILRRYYGFGAPPLTLGEVGELFSLTRERIRQLRNRALKKLYETEQGKALGRDYCGDDIRPSKIVTSD